MKKGVFTLILSFVLGMVWLIYSIMNHHGFGVIFITKPFSFMSHTVMLPELNVPSFYIMGILALFVNLLALILAMPSFAMGAAVLYAAAIGFEPDCYPYAGVLFLLCLFATARMRKPESGNRAQDLADQIASSRNVEPKLSASQTTAYVQHSTDGSTSYAAMRAQEEKAASRSGKDSKIAAITILIILISAMAVVIPALMQAKRSRTQNSTTRETKFSAAGTPVYDPDLRQKGDRKDAGSGQSADGGTVTSDGQDGSGQSESAAGKRIDLTGEWVSDTKQSSGSGMEASISDDEIQVFWVNSDGSRTSYWTGTWKQMQSFQEPYLLVSVRTKPVDPNNSFASQSNTMVFTYTDSDGILSFSTKIMGLPVTYRLHRV